MKLTSKKNATLLLLVLMLSGCASTRVPLVVPPPKLPPPPAELMSPLPASPVNVEQLLLQWTHMLESWRASLEACKATPLKCV